ncbi:MAG: superoxide dismutase family protein [Myxococcota bacterium]
MRRDAIIVVVMLLAAPAVAQESKKEKAPLVEHRVELKDAKGAPVGTVTLTETPSGVLIKGDLQNVPPGVHAIHIHDVGKCEPPFESAGGHFNPTHKSHGYELKAGHHAGDLPNITVPETGKLQFEHLASDITISKGESSLLDKDGAAIVIHASADDYETQPSGASGNRIACGEITKK